MKENRRYMLRTENKGVSEVIATLLVLVITVTLFASIFAWIQVMPPPASKRYLDLSGTLAVSYESGNYSFYINITHKGGERLYANSTSIYLQLLNSTIRYGPLSLSDGNIADGIWEPGDVWAWKRNTSSLANLSKGVAVQIIDTVKNLLVWSNVLMPPETDIPPSILERGTTPEQVSVGGVFKVWAIVKDDDLNLDSVYVNLSSMGCGTVKMNWTFGWKFETANITCNAGAGKYLAIINATDNMGHIAMATIEITVVTTVAEDTSPPKLIVERILLSNSSPTRGDSVTITAVIKNLNARPATSSNITFVDYYSIDGTWTQIGTPQNISVAGYGQTQTYMTWIATPGGLHTLYVNITNVMPGNTTGIGGNISVIVTPKILLVDDDAAVMGSGSNLDVASYMASALDAANLKYRIYSVPFGLDGPKYATGALDAQMQYYDVVIWVGGSTNNSLTTNDTTELQKFMQNGGKLWLVGENILEGVDSGFMNYVGVNGVLPASPMPPQMYGQNPGTGWINLSNCQPMMLNATPFDILRPINPLASLNVKAVFMNGSADKYYGIQYKNVVGTKEYRVVTFTFEFAGMKDTGDQAITAYKVVNWLSGLGNRTGEDLAVASQYIEPTNPRYMQPVNISATIRNNGASVQANVEVLAYVYIGGALLDTISPLNSSITLQPDGGSAVVNFTWLPRMVGTYVVKVVVDPNNKVIETNEDNNVLSSAVGVHEISVLYTLLVVDDDSSAENGGGGTLPNVAQYVIDALTSLGYVNGSDMDIQKVPKGADRNNTEYNATNYNCIVWITGFANNGSGYNTLTAGDMSIIKDLYLPSDPLQHTFILIGRDVLTDNGVKNTAFMTQVLGAATPGTSSTLSAGKTLYGVRESPVTNGMTFRFDNTSAGSFPAVAYTKTLGAIPLFWANGTDYWSRQNDNVMGTAVKDASGWHSAFLAFDLSYTTDFSLVKEMLFSLIHWGGRIDALPELRVTPPDIFAATNSLPYIILPDLNPQVGSSYILKANITNLGGLSADVILRFLEGSSIINSVNIHVPGSYSDTLASVYNGKCTAEIIWTPLYAGYESIGAVIDPDNLYAGAEKMRHNNNASQQIQVFFFYDDMEIAERTAANWNHDATLLNINGETALDFISRPDLNTKVISDWDWSASGSTDFAGTTRLGGNGTYQTDWANVTNYTKGSAHTPSKAYWLPEVPMMETGKRMPIDLVIVFDVSGSMNWGDGFGGVRLTDAKNAAKAAVGMLGENDRIAIVTFSYTPSLYLPFRYTNTSADRASINSSIDAITADGATALFDASSYGTYYMDTSGRSNAVRGLIFLTDGVANWDYQSSTTWYKYAPGSGNGYEPDEPGPVQYYTAGNGLCGMPYNVFTVSIGTTPDARMHAMSLTAPSNISYGVVCSNPQKLADLFMLFVEKLLMESTGGIRAPGQAPGFESNAVNKPVTQGVSLSNMPFVVFADGFRSKDWTAPMLGTWIPWTRSSGWSISENSFWYDGYRTLAYTSSSGQTLVARIDASPVLTKLANTGTSYTVKYVNVSFLARGGIAVDVSIDGSTWSTAGSGSYGGDGIGDGTYVQYPIKSYINPGAPFYVRFRSTSSLYLDDPIVLYVLDTIGAGGGGGGSGGADATYNATIQPAKYRFLTTPSVRVGTPYLAFWNYATGSYETGNLPDHVVVIDYENAYYWLYDASGAVAYQGNFIVLQNNSYTGNASKTGALNVAPVTYLLNPTPEKDSWFAINDYYGWKYWYLPAIPNAQRDMLIAWEDLWGTVPLSSIDGNGDQWVRVTLLNDGTFRVVPYRASGGYEHDFFVGSDWVYIKHHSEAWSNGAGTSVTDPYKEVYVVPSGQHFPLFLRKSEGGTLSFYTRYSMTGGTNGGFLYLWGSTDGRTWVWDQNHRVYLEPKQTYNQNLKFDAVDNESTTGGLAGNGLIDVDGKLPYWCFGGRSAGGTYGWEKIEVDLASYVRTFAAIRIVFVFAQFGGTLSPNWTADMGWYIDDVQIRVKGGVPDYWKIVENATQAHSGSRYWYFCSPSNYLPLGVDSSLYTIPIDLTRAYKATLIAFFKFNINDGAGLPPDGVRVEVSKDNGETWYSVTYGVRMAWGYSGRDTTTIENRGYYGVTGDVAGGELPQRYSGVRGTLYKTNWTFVRASDADTKSVYDWVPSFTLVRLNCDLSGFAGNTIILRIRVFTNATGSETDAIHYASAGYDKGVFVDDVFVIGTSIVHPIGGDVQCARP